jgi:hypothetical protein
MARGYRMRSLGGVGPLSSGRGWLVSRNAPCYRLTLFSTRFSATKKQPTLWVTPFFADEIAAEELSVSPLHAKFTPAWRTRTDSPELCW